MKYPNAKNMKSAKVKIAFTRKQHCTQFVYNGEIMFAKQM